MAIIIQFVVLVAGFVLLIKGADIFVDGASKIASRLGVPLLVIGLTIVAMGTSAPEAAISISAALRGSAEIAVGNVLGSNILNVLLILGISAVIMPLAVQKSTLRYEIPFTFAITALFALLGLSDNVIALGDGIILWILFIAYLSYLFIMAKKGNGDEQEANNQPQDKVWKLILLIVIGIALIIIGSNVTVDAAKKIAAFFGMSERLIGLTVVALGTSLPELVTSVVAALRGKADIAVGNIIGSNVFNILFVIGTSALITPVVYGAEFLADSIVCVLITVLLFLLVVNKKRKLNRFGGIIMLAAFVAYITNLIATSM